MKRKYKVGDTVRIISKKEFLAKIQFADFDRHFNDGGYKNFNRARRLSGFSLQIRKQFFGKVCIISHIDDSSPIPSYLLWTEVDSSLSWYEIFFDKKYKGN